MASTVMATQTGRGREIALEGLRGALLLYVMLHHTSRRAVVDEVHVVLGNGFLPVDAFFLLSGFVLMMSFERHGRAFFGGVRAYLRRRMRRLLLPYYAALALAVGMLYVVPTHMIDGTLVTLPALTLPSFLAHAALVQNAFDQFVLAINGALWFIAMEAQLSLAFPFLVLAWQRFGTKLFLVALGAFSFACVLAFGEGSYFFKVQYLLVFVLGMAAARARERFSHAPRDGTLWLSLWAGLIALAAMRLGVALLPGFPHAAVVISADACAAAVGYALVMLSVSKRANLLKRLMEQPAFVWLGGVSFSAYLLHIPITRILMHFWLLPSGLSEPAQFALLTVVGIPLALAAAIPFRAVFETPFSEPRQPASTAATP